jgi:protein TonB
VQHLDIPAKNVAAGTEFLAGLIEAPRGLLISQGPGDGGGAGSGDDGGLGPKKGSGLGPGQDRGTGGELYRTGNGVTLPIVRHRETPQYTQDAVRARIQGSVIVECIVQVSGICSDIRVVRSLDRMFGLDAEAIRTARSWRFLPGTRMGQPVPVVVTIELAFSIH